MPYKIVSRGKGKAEVVTIATGKGHGVTSIARARKQRRLLEMIEHGGKPQRKKSR